MTEYREGVYVPEPGDIINYRDADHEFLNAWVTLVGSQGGFSDVWLNGQTQSHFNVNHFTGLPNTQYSKRGTWELVTRAADVPQTAREFRFPDEPTDVRRLEVIGAPDVTFVYDGVRWECEQDNLRYTWSRMKSLYTSGYREVVESEYEAALRRLRAAQVGDSAQFRIYVGRNKDMSTVIARALEQ